MSKILKVVDSFVKAEVVLGKVYINNSEFPWDFFNPNVVSLEESDTPDKSLLMVLHELNFQQAVLQRIEIQFSQLVDLITLIGIGDVGMKTNSVLKPFVFYGVNGVDDGRIPFLNRFVTRGDCQYTFSEFGLTFSNRKGGYRIGKPESGRIVVNRFKETWGICAGNLTMFQTKSLDALWELLDVFKACGVDVDTRLAEDALLERMRETGRPEDYLLEVTTFGLRYNTDGESILESWDEVRERGLPFGKYGNEFRDLKTGAIVLDFGDNLMDELSTTCDFISAFGNLVVEDWEEPNKFEMSLTSDAIFVTKDGKVYKYTVEAVAELVVRKGILVAEIGE